MCTRGTQIIVWRCTRFSLNLTFCLVQILQYWKTKNVDNFDITTHESRSLILNCLDKMVKMRKLGQCFGKELIFQYILGHICYIPCMAYVHRQSGRTTNQFSLKILHQDKYLSSRPHLNFVRKYSLILLLNCNF